MNKKSDCLLQNISETSLLPIWSTINQIMKNRIVRWKLHFPAAVTLLHLHAHPEDAEPARLSEAVSIPRQTMTFTLDSPEKQKLAFRKSHPNDRRRKTILLSDKGKKLADAIIQDLLAFEEKAFSEFSATEFKTFRTLSEKLADALKKAETKV